MITIKEYKVGKIKPLNKGKARINGYIDWINKAKYYIFIVQQKLTSKGQKNLCINVSLAYVH